MGGIPLFPPAAIWVGFAIVAFLLVMRKHLRKKQKDNDGVCVRQIVDDGQWWCDCAFDLHGAVFHEDVDLNGVTFEHGPNLHGAKFERIADFRVATFTSGDLHILRALPQGDLQTCRRLPQGKCWGIVAYVCSL